MKAGNTQLCRREFLRRAAAGSAGLVVGLPSRAWDDDEVAPQTVFPVLDLEGTPRERGRLHGERLAESIHAVHEGWRRSLQVPDGWSTEKYIERFVADTSFPEAIRRWTPGLEDEVRGIAEGCGLPHRDIFAMQLLDEEWWYGMTLRRRLSRSGDKCTVVGASRTDSHPSLVAQNMDIPSYANPHLVLLRFREPASSLQQLVLTLAGVVSLNGMNERGVAVCVNALLQLKPTPKGLPIAYTNRGVIAQDGFEEADHFIRAVTVASGQAYNIGGPERVVSYECSAAGAAPVPLDARGRLVHTNHPVVSKDLGWYGELWRDRQAGPGGNSETRLRCAATRLEDAEMNVELLRRTLGSHDEGHAICRHLTPRGGGYTAASTVYELGDTPRLHLTGNPPCKAPVTTIGF